MNAASRILERVARSRIEFDCAFAEPPRFTDVATIDLLAIRAGSRSFAIRVSEVAGLHLGKKITVVPGTNKTIRGIAAFRAAIFPVYDLAVLLGEPATTAAPRWLVVAKSAPVALSFHAFEGQRRVFSGDIVSPAPTERIQQHARALVRGPLWTGPLLTLASVIEVISAATIPSGSQQEK